MTAEFTREPADPVTQLEFQTWTQHKEDECRDHLTETRDAIQRIAVLDSLSARARLNRRAIRRLGAKIESHSGLLLANRVLAISTAAMVFLLLVAHYPQLAGVLRLIVAVIHG